MIKKVGNMWAVAHSHPKQSARDKAPGTIIKKFKNRKDALKMHAAIILSEMERGTYPYKRKNIS